MKKSNHEAERRHERLEKGARAPLVKERTERQLQTQTSLTMAETQSDEGGTAERAGQAA